MKNKVWIFVVIVMLLLTGCQLNEAEFEDFDDFEDDFILVRDFLVEFNFTRDDASPLTVE